MIVIWATMAGQMVALVCLGLTLVGVNVGSVWRWLAWSSGTFVLVLLGSAAAVLVLSHA
jgi:hypothetical protein